jgi:phosphoglycerol geranylgeranyltransferase
MNTDTNPWKNWRHITKLDPDKDLSSEDLNTIVESGTDAIMISGTQNITDTNVSQLVSRLRDYDLPKILEPATPDAVVDDDVDYVFVPLVLNTGDLSWIVGKHKDWILHHQISWEKVIPEAYIVMNPESAVAKVTKSTTDLSGDEVVAYAHYAEKYLRLPIVYLEYSGTYGDPELVQRLSESLTEAALFYGGGIESHETAAEMKRYADVIIVGNVVYTDMDKYIATLL